MSPNLNKSDAESEGGPVSSASGALPLRGAYVHRRGENADDERLAAEFWRGCGLGVEFLEEPTERFSRRPDMRLLRDGRAWALCEVKTIWRHSWTVRVLHEDGPPKERQEITSTPVLERLAGDLVTASRQLRAENPDHLLPNIVILVNRDAEASIGDFSGLLCAKPAASERGTRARREAGIAGEIQAFRHDVDLCIWANAQTGPRLSVEGYFVFNSELQEQFKEIVGLGHDKLVSLNPAA